MPTIAIIILGLVCVVVGPVMAVLGFMAAANSLPGGGVPPIYVFYAGAAIYALGPILIAVAAWRAWPS